MAYPKNYAEAVVYFQNAKALVGQNVHFRKVKAKPNEALVAAHDTIRSLVPPGRYTYYETEGVEPIVYEIHDVLEEMESGQFFVNLARVSRPLLGRSQLLILVGSDRFQGFLNPVDVPGFRGVRFTPVADDVVMI